MEVSDDTQYEEKKGVSIDSEGSNSQVGCDEKTDRQKSRNGPEAGSVDNKKKSNIQVAGDGNETGKAGERKSGKKNRKERKKRKNRQNKDKRPTEAAGGNCEKPNGGGKATRYIKNEEKKGVNVDREGSNNPQVDGDEKNDRQKSRNGPEAGQVGNKKNTTPQVDGDEKADRQKSRNGPEAEQVGNKKNTTPQVDGDEKNDRQKSRNGPEAGQVGNKKNTTPQVAGDEKETGKADVKPHDTDEKDADCIIQQGESPRSVQNAETPALSIAEKVSWKERNKSKYGDKHTVMRIGGGGDPRNPKGVHSTFSSDLPVLKPPCAVTKTDVKKWAKNGIKMNKSGKPKMEVASAGASASALINVIDTFDRPGNSEAEGTFAKAGTYAHCENKAGKRIPKAGAFAEAGVGTASAEWSIFEASAKGPNASAGAEASALGVSAMATAGLASASASAGPLGIKVGLSVDTGVAVGVDGASLKFLGTGVSIGPKTSVAILGNEVSCCIS